MNAVIAAAAELQAVCEAEGWRHCLIGGVALQRWGEARETVDVDLTLLTGFGDEARFITRLTAIFAGRRSIAGIEHGRAVILEGVAARDRDRNVILNPAYTLIAPAHPH